jgi:hypothetical protein
VIDFTQGRPRSRRHCDRLRHSERDVVVWREVALHWGLLGIASGSLLGFAGRRIDGYNRLASERFTEGCDKPQKSRHTRRSSRSRENLSRMSSPCVAAPDQSELSDHHRGENVMISKCWRLSGLAALFFLVALCSGDAGNAVAAQEGKGADFKGKIVDMKDKAEFAVLLTFSAGTPVTATTKGTKKSDVHLFVYDEDKKEVGKDVSPGPNCEVKFTPAQAGIYKFLVKNSGGSNKVTLEVKVAN